MNRTVRQWTDGRGATNFAYEDEALVGVFENGGTPLAAQRASRFPLRRTHACRRRRRSKNEGVQCTLLLGERAALTARIVFWFPHDLPPRLRAATANGE